MFLTDSGEKDGEGFREEVTLELEEEGSSQTTEQEHPQEGWRP